MGAPESVSRGVKGTSPARLEGTRIVIVLEGLELAGAERQAILLARHLVRHERAHVEIWCMSKPGRGAAMCAEEGIPWRLVPVDPRWSRWRLPLILARFARELRGFRADVVLPYTLVPNVLCCATARWCGARLTVWNQRDAGLARIARRLERWAARRAGLVVSNSRPGARFLAEALGVAPERIRLVPSGVEAVTRVPSREAMRESLGVGTEAFLACMVAHLNDYKDHATLLRAWKMVVERVGDTRPTILLLAGRFGETHASLVALARQLRIESRVRFLGPVTDVPGLLAAMDLGVHSSRLEGCPNGVLESMAAGLAIAGTDNEGIRDAVCEDGENLLAPAGDPHALADRILLAAADPALRARLGEANRARALREFSAERMCETMTGLILRGLLAP